MKKFLKKEIKLRIFCFFVRQNSTNFLRGRKRMLNEKLFIEEPLFELEEANEKYMPSVIARSLKKRKIGVNLRKKSPKSAKIANFGKKIKLSEVTEDQVDLMELVVIEMRSMVA